MSDFPKPNFVIRKVFDCQDMPPEVKKTFFNLTSDYSNDTYTRWTVGFIDQEDPDDYDEDVIGWYKLVDDWLASNGAGEEEEVLVSHWW